MSTPSNYSFVVSPEEDGQRLDQFLTRQTIFSSRGRAQLAIEEGGVTCDQIVIEKMGHKVREGQVVVCRVPVQNMTRDLIPDTDSSVSLDILYQDEHILVLEKASGVCVHAGAGNPHGTLVEKVLGQGIPLSPVGLPIRPGVVHRLDKGTSGVMVMAKTEAASTSLVEQFSKKMVEKVYLALAIGKLRVLSGTIRSNLGRHPVNRQLFSSGSRQGKEAITHYRVLSGSPSITFVEVKIETGRTHQIRVHFSELGHPLVGDDGYGGGPRRLKHLSVTGAERAALNGVEWPMLHAYRLSFNHPISKERMTFSVPLPERFQPFIDSAQWVSYGRSSISS